MRKKLASFLVAGSLALTGLVGCAGGGGAAPEPKDTAELVALYEKTEKDNAHMDLTMDMSMGFGGQTMDIPFTGSYDSAGGNVKGTMTMDLSVLGVDKIDMQMYAVQDAGGYTQYMSVDGENWMKQKSESGAFTSQITNVDLLADGEFSKTETGYEVAITGDKLLGAISAATGGANESLIGNDESTKAALAGTDAIFAFDKEGKLTSVAMNMDFDQSGASVKLDLKVTLSDYGKIDAASIAVPDEVVSSAIDLGSDDDSALLEEVAEADEVAGEAGAATSADSATDAAAAEADAASATDAAEADAAADSAVAEAAADAAAADSASSAA